MYLLELFLLININILLSTRLVDKDKSNKYTCVMFIFGLRGYSCCVSGEYKGFL